MAKVSVWNTGRFGYGGHLNGNTAGIESNKLLKPKTVSLGELASSEYKELIIAGKFNEAFDLIMECDWMSYKRKCEILEITHPMFDN